jgi:hypothetical protein
VPREPYNEPRKKIFTKLKVYSPAIIEKPEIELGDRSKIPSHT